MGQFLLDIRLLADKLREYNPTAIVAPIRGALVPAVYLSHLLEGSKVIPYHMDKEHNLPEGVDWSRTLILDDISDSGDTLSTLIARMSAHLSNVDAEGSFMIRTASLITRYTTKVVPNYTAFAINDGRWVVFPWEQQ